MSYRRVVVTGLGVVSPLGQDVPTFWRRLIAGERGLGVITKFDPTGLRNPTGGQVWDWAFDPAELGLTEAPDEATQFLLQATREALRDAGLDASPAAKPDAGAVLSTNFGGSLSWESFCHQSSDRGAGVPPAAVGEPDRQAGRLPHAEVRAFAEFAFHTALCHVREVFGLQGPMSLLSVACASGAAAVGRGLDLLRAGEARVMVCGGHDSLAPSPLSGLSTLHTITAEDIRPFSADRGGTLFGEGAAMLVLETLEHAAARGARVYAEVLGSWQNNNAYHLTAPDPGGAGMARVLREALQDAGLAPDQLDYINAHGTGTEHHDPAETEAIKTVLGSHAYAIPVSSLKAATGHLMAAAGALEAVATVKALATGVIPPTVNYRAADPACDLDYVPNVARHTHVRHAATLSAGVGGSNACVVLGQPPSGPGVPPAAVPDTARQARRLPHEAHRVLLTGLAPISAIGIGREDFWQGLREGRDGRRPPERLAEAAGALPLLAECLDFVVQDYLDSAKTYLDRCSELTLAACHLAFADAGLNWRALNRERVGLAVGTAYGCLDSMANMTARVQAKGLRFGSPVIFTHSFANSPASLAAIEYGIQGPAGTFCVGDVSAAEALAYGRQLIREGRADVVLAGGVEALSAPLLTYLRELGPDFVPGEGAALLVLESEAHAAARQATVWGELLSVTVTGSPGPAVAAPAPYGHTFGAKLALDAIAALATGGPDITLTAADPCGLAACLGLRRA